MELGGHVPSLAPGMSQTIIAGEAYTIKDDNGGEVEFVGRDRPWVIEFLKVFRDYMETSAVLDSEHTIVQRLALELRDKWEAIPADLRDMLPKSVGIRL